MLTVPAAQGAMTYKDWKHTLEYTITNPPSIPYVQFPVTVTWEPDMAPDFRDIRFIVGNSAVPYVILSKTDGVTADVRVNPLTETGFTRLTLFYGNPAAESESNGDDVFQFFEHFDEATLDPAKWYEKQAGSYSISNSIFRATSSEYHSIYQLGNDETFECRMAFDGTEGALGAALIEYQGDFGANHLYFHYYPDPETDFHVISCGTSCGGMHTNLTKDTDYHTWKIIRSGGYTSVKFYIDGTLYYTETYANYLPDCDLSIHLRYYPYYDWVLARTYVATEPVATFLRKKANVNYFSDFTRHYADHGFPRSYLDLNNYNVISMEVKKSIFDACWTLKATIDGLVSPPVNTCFYATFTDYDSVEHTRFVGIMTTAPDHQYKPQGVVTTINAVSYGFFLTKQGLPNGDISYPNSATWHPKALLLYFIAEELPTDPEGTGLWRQVTGIYPQRIDGPWTWSHLWDFEKAFVFKRGQTKWDAIQDISSNTKMIFHTKPLLVGDTYEDAGYFVYVDDIDHAEHGFDLPEIAVIGGTTSSAIIGEVIVGEFIVGGGGVAGLSSTAYVRRNEPSGERVNRVIVRGLTTAGVACEYIKESAGLQAHTELPIEHCEEDAAYNTVAKCQTRANELFNSFNNEAISYNAKLMLRADLELYQKIKFIGFDIPEDVMRIISITYHSAVVDNWVEVQCVKDTDMAKLFISQRSTEPDIVKETEGIVKRYLLKSDSLRLLGTIKSIVGDAATVTTERNVEDIDDVILLNQ